jgi:murein DD-endopeptidase MepM/ murein hydrolase activator NlpD
MNKLAKSLLYKVFATFISFFLSTSLTNPKPVIAGNKDSNRAWETINVMQEFKKKGFYDNNPSNLPITLPFDTSKVYRISGEFGEFRNLPIPHTHKGIDFAGKKGSSIYSSANGIVIRANRGIGYGKVIMIKHENNLQTTYAHLNKIEVAVGDTVIAGQEIGKLGNTGWSTGPHLHYEVRFHKMPIDPLILFKVEESTTSYKDIIERAKFYKTLFYETFSNISRKVHDSRRISIEETGITKKMG